MKNRNSVLVTGSSGFVGQRYCEVSAESHKIEKISLTKTSIKEIDFSNITTIVHLAGIAHRMEKIDDKIYFDVNYILTKNLAIAAKKAGIRQFVFISTVKVYGDDHGLEYLDLNTPTHPNDAYGKSKLAGENALIELQDENFIVSIIRPPLIYGPGVKGNLIKFLHLAQKNYPLPFKGIINKRSMVFLDNFVALINAIIEKKANGIFIAGDKTVISTSDLLGFIFIGLSKKPKWFKMPALGIKLLKLIKPELIKRLFGSYVIDNSTTNKILDFNPPYETAYGIKTMTDWFLKEQNK